MSFINEPIDRAELPALDEATFQPLDPAHLRVSLIGHGLVAFVAVAGGIAGATMFDPAVATLIAAGVVLLVVLSYVREALAVRHTGWQVRDHDISYRHGVVVRSVQTLPFVRIQHTRITRSLVQRRFGLATLHVNTAGPDIAIVGLASSDAERLKILLIERAGDLDDAVL